MDIKTAPITRNCGLIFFINELYCNSFRSSTVAILRIKLRACDYDQTNMNDVADYRCSILQTLSFVLCFLPFY